MPIALTSSLAFALTFAVSFVVTRMVAAWARTHGIVDSGDGGRKLQPWPVPLLGGVGIWVSFIVVVWLLALVTGWVVGKDVSYPMLVTLTLGSSIIMIGGYLDDRCRLSPFKQLVAPVAAAALVVASGIQARVITNPLGGSLELIGAASAAVSFLWLMVAMYTTKLLDGLDGLASGIGMVGSLVLFGFTVFTPFYQPSVGLLAVALAGACAGFLVLNWHPARVYLGEGGSLFLGFMLGVLAIISGSKIATALLIMGIPMLDMVWVAVRRMVKEGKSFAAADRTHLHYRLLETGLTHQQTVVLLIACSAGFGISSFFIRTHGKVIALGLLIIVMTALAVFGTMYKSFHRSR